MDGQGYVSVLQCVGLCDYWFCFKIELGGQCYFGIGVVVEFLFLMKGFYDVFFVVVRVDIMVVFGVVCDMQLFEIGVIKDICFK